jgi:UDP-N-acetylglucosamine 4,6-dehydratase/5-epimerase
VDKVLILGATGTLGRAMIKELLENGSAREIRCVSRDELKLSELKKEFNDIRIKTFIGDIRDKTSIAPQFRGVDTVFHFAALKRIPEMEAQPVECLKTNVLGTLNAAELARDYGIKDFIFSSTDKAALPINAYGKAKGLSEDILFSMNGGATNFSVYRWGNIVSSRGAVTHAFSEAAVKGEPAKITDPEMTRFWIKIESAVKFILSSYAIPSNEPKIPKMKAARVVRVLEAICKIKGASVNYVITGIRPGEKLHENIVFERDKAQQPSSFTSPWYTDDELVELLEGSV